MTSASVRDAVYGIGAITNGNTAKNTESTQSGGHDFGKIMNQVKTQAKQTVHQSDNQMTEKKTVPQTKETQEVKEDIETQKPAAKEEIRENKPVDDTSEKIENVSENEPVDEELEAAVEDAVKEIMQEVEEALDVSEEEVLAVMQQLGLQPMDLLNSDNMAAIMAALTGEDSTIQLVMDEDMYSTLQDLMQMVDETTQELLSSTGLTEEELEAVLDQLKLLIEQQMSKEGNGTQQAQILPFEQPETLAEAGEVLEEGEIPVIVKNDTDKGANNLQSTEVSQENATKELVESTESGQESGKNEESLFEQQQQQNMQGFQNVAEEVNELMRESKAQGADVPNTESILKQLADFVKIQNGKELTEMELQLHPASLGNVRVMLSTKGGVVTAQLMTENEAVKNAIESQVSQLKLNLEEQGIKVEAIEVSVASHQMERNLDQNTGEHQNKEQTDGIHKVRKTSINLNSYENEEELVEDIGEPDDATRIAMEMMAIGGNRMDLLA